MSTLKRISQALKCRLLCEGFLNFFDTVIDNIVFRLQYKVTTMVLLLFSLSVALRQLFGSTMKCMAREFPDYAEDHCYVHPTYSIVEAWNNSTVQVPYPGVTKNSKGTRVYHHYYQWVSSVLFLQAVLFIIPWYLWKTIEQNRVRDVLKEFKNSTNTSKIKFQPLLVEIASTSQNWLYLTLFLVIEFLNVVNVIGQIILMDKFLGGSFLTYGSEVLNQPWGTQENLYDPMVRVFPRVAKCDFKRFGVSGDVQLNTVQCTLPLNVIHDKLYLFLWFWFIILATLSSLALVYRLVLLLIPKIRERILMLQTRLDKKTVHFVARSLDIGDWFFLYMVNKSLKPSRRDELMVFLSKTSDNGDLDAQELEYLK